MQRERDTERETQRDTQRRTERETHTDRERDTETNQDRHTIVTGSGGAYLRDEHATLGHFRPVREEDSKRVSGQRIEDAEAEGGREEEEEGEQRSFCEERERGEKRREGREERERGVRRESGESGERGERRDGGREKGERRERRERREGREGREGREEGVTARSPGRTRSAPPPKTAARASINGGSASGNGGAAHPVPQEGQRVLVVDLKARVLIHPLAPPVRITRTLSTSRLGRDCLRRGVSAVQRPGQRASLTLAACRGTPRTRFCRGRTSPPGSAAATSAPHIADRRPRSMGARCLLH
eukprot:1828113-Rhodomonas_salina.1